MCGNRVPDPTHGFKPFAASTAYKGVNSPSGTFRVDPPSRGVRVRHVYLAALVAARTLGGPA